MCVNWVYFLAVLYGLATTGVLRVSGMRVYTSGDVVEAVNGTDVRLRCTFETSATINPATITISWTFRPQGPGRVESVFYYQNKQQYPPLPQGRFHKRIVWAGDILGRDASIVVRQVKFTYNGTFSCEVKNPPDVHGNTGEVRLRVVTTASFSEILKLVLIIAGAVMGVIVLLVIVLSIRRCRKEHREHRDGVEEGAPRRERKDPTVCHPALAAHLYKTEEEYEVDSDDGMISEASTKDPSSSEAEDDDSYDDPGGISD